MIRFCTDCHERLHHSARSPVCLACRSSRTCTSCDTPISWRSKGMCRACSNAAIRVRPGYVERQREGINRFNRDPEHAEARRAKAQKAARTKLADPAKAARLRENGRLYGAPNLAKSRSPASRAKAGASRTASVLAWCPPELRDRYRWLKTTKLLSAATAKAIILDEVKATERRRVAALTPFERQVEALNRGAALVAKPIYRTADPAYTLGGVSDMGA